ncbi:MAG: hypothetical protein KAY24_19995 [Candidatus Eisenbacteria sp.]|nr:hypothetical protein [Candidatus Eisenbacteria bacterium]
MNAKDVAKAIDGVPILEVISIEEDGDKRIRIHHRVQRRRNAVWMGVLDHVLSRKSGWDYHICRQYRFIRGKMRYHWNFIAQWGDKKDKIAVCKQITSLFRNAATQMPVIRQQLDSYPLVGAAKNRNAPEGAFNPSRSGYGQKGAHRIKG